MEGRELVRAILRAHQNRASFEPYPTVTIAPQTGYKGAVAITAYRGWRARSHRDRPKVGLFDIKVMVSGKDMEHERSVIIPTVSSLSQEMAEAIFNGGSPEAVPGETQQKTVMATLQAAMVEQEINWGPEPFQCKTFFAPPTRRTHDGRVVTSRPRDFLMGYIRKCYDLRGGNDWTTEVESTVRDFLASRREQRASRSAALMPKMKGKFVDPAWERFHEDPRGTAEPWLWGDVLEEYREFAASAPDNPKYRVPNGH